MVKNIQKIRFNIIIIIIENLRSQPHGVGETVF